MMVVEENRRVLWYAVPNLHDRCINFRMILFAAIDLELKSLICIR